VANFATTAVTALTIGAATAAGSFGGNYGASQMRSPAPIAAAQGLTPADYFAAGMACNSYDSVGIDSGNAQVEAARSTEKAFMAEAIKAAGIDPSKCAKF